VIGAPHFRGSGNGESRRVHGDTKIINKKAMHMIARFML
jgi:hypothetical protein